MTANRIFLVIALVLFILEGLGVGVVPHQLSWGLASLVASMLL